MNGDTLAILFGISFGLFLCLGVLVGGMSYLLRTSDVPGGTASYEEMVEFLEDVGDL